MPAGMEVGQAAQLESVGKPPISQRGAPAQDIAGVSIIIPTLNEQMLIEQTLESAIAAGPLEIVVADGGSSDDTVDIARRVPGVVIVESWPGRARQMNTGATVATGETLLFLHADTRLPADACQTARRVLDGTGVAGGAFQLRIDGKGWPLRVIERGVAFRSKQRSLPYGDQGIFLRADMFHLLGGFPDQPVMEDYELVRRLGRHGRIEMAEDAVVTSGRRWQELGPLRATAQNLAHVTAYRLGVAVDRIAGWRSR